MESVGKPKPATKFEAQESIQIIKNMYLIPTKITGKQVQSEKRAKTCHRIVLQWRSFLAHETLKKDCHNWIGQRPKMYY